jgi:hypothetical protein
MAASPALRGGSGRDGAGIRSLAVRRRGSAGHDRGRALVIARGNAADGLRSIAPIGPAKRRPRSRSNRAGARSRRHRRSPPGCAACRQAIFLPRGWTMRVFADGVRRRGVGALLTQSMDRIARARVAAPIGSAALRRRCPSLRHKLCAASAESLQSQATPREANQRPPKRTVTIHRTAVDIAFW